MPEYGALPRHVWRLAGGDEILPAVRRQYWDNSLANVALYGAIGNRLITSDDPVSRYVA